MCKSGGIKELFEKRKIDTQLFEELFILLETNPETSEEVIHILIEYIEIKDGDEKKNLQEFDILADVICKTVEKFPNSTNRKKRIRDITHSISDSKRQAIRDNDRLIDFLKEVSADFCNEIRKEKKASDEIRESLQELARKKRK